MALITLKDVTIAFEGVPAVEHVSYQVNLGDYMVLIGENGSGKSTLMRAMLGLVHPCSGTVRYGDGLKRNQIGYLPQQTAVQRDFPASVREVVLSGCLNSLGGRLFYSKADRERAQMNMERMGIDELADTSYHALSGGQQQRVLLARALCATKKLLLLGEPVTGLDPIAAGEMYNLIKLVNLCDGISVIMVSHDIHEAVRYATHILHLGHRQLFFGTAAEYKESDLARRFLGGNRV